MRRAGIYFLYTQILLHIFFDIHELEVFDIHELEVFVSLRRVLEAIVHASNPLSRRELATILGSSTSSVSTTLCQEIGTFSSRVISGIAVTVILREESCQDLERTILVM